MALKSSVDSDAEPVLQSLCDPQTIEQLLLDPAYQQQVARIARKHTRGTTVSWEEAAQTAHLKILQTVRAGKFRQGNDQSFHRWATVVARFEIIDLIRKEKYRNCKSLDQALPGTDVPLLDTIADTFDLLDTIERSDLVLRAIAAITDLDQRHPDRHYLKLWQGQLAGKNQSQLAAELSLTQGTISRRWKELVSRLADALGLLQPEAVKQTMRTTQAPSPKAVRTRSDTSW
jgi:RNA polymerase sporulation-specific sigma factor